MPRLKAVNLDNLARIALLSGSFLALGLLLVSMPLTNTEAADFIVVDAIDAADFGFGYDTERQQLKARGGGCIAFDAAHTFENGAPSSNSKLKHVKSTSQVVENMNVSVSGQLSALTPKGTFGIAPKLELAKNTEISQYSESLFAYSYARKPVVFLHPASIRLKPEYLSMLNDSQKGIGAFRAACGDTFVWGIQKSREFYGIATLKRQTQEAWSQFKAGGSASYEAPSGAASGEAEVGYSKTLKQYFGEDSLEVDSRSSDPSIKNSTTIDEMISQYRDFNKESKAGLKATKYVLGSYAYAANWPIRDPLSPSNNDIGLSSVVKALWDLKTLEQDANFIENHHEQFAMGTKPDKREERMKAIKLARARWKSEFRKLTDLAANCLKDFDQQCKAKAAEYENRDVMAERDVLPKRYSSDCRQTIQLTELAEQVGGYHMERSPRKGDNEMDGGPVKVRMSAKFSAEDRQLKLEHETRLLEWKEKNGKRQTSRRQNTEFWGRRDVIVFDLDHPNQHSPGQKHKLYGNLKECTFADNPVFAPYVTDPNNPESVAFKWHGWAEDKSGKKPRNFVKLIRGTRGLLTFSECMLDRRGRDGKLECRAPGIRNTNVKLVNELDLIADKWTPRDTKKVPSTPPVAALRHMQPSISQMPPEVQKLIETRTAKTK